MTQYTYESQRATCGSVLSHFTMWILGNKVRPSGLVTTTFVHLTSPKVMFSTIRYWSDSDSVLPRVQDVPRSSRKSMHTFILAKCIIYFYTARKKWTYYLKGWRHNSARLLLTLGDLSWCFFRLRTDNDETNGFTTATKTGAKISHQQQFSCYPLEG